MRVERSARLYNGRLVVPSGAAQVECNARKAQVPRFFERVAAASTATTIETRNPLASQCSQRGTAAP
jgi:hypothetical protein